MKKNERLHSLEFGAAIAEEKSVETVVMQASIEKMYAKRSQMLSALTEYISLPLYKVLEKKIQGEVKDFETIIQSEKAFEEAKKARKKLLDENYFLEKQLDINIFE